MALMKRLDNECVTYYHNKDKSITKSVCTGFDSEGIPLNKKSRIDATVREVKQAEKILLKHNLMQPKEEFEKIAKSKERKCPECGIKGMKLNKEKNELLCPYCGLVIAKYPFEINYYEKARDIIKNRDSKEKLKRIIQE